MSRPIGNDAFELVILKGGGRSIRSKEHGETMHIGTDPRTEALQLHVNQQKLADRVREWSNNDPFVIWDIGLGPAGNAISALEVIRDSFTPVELHSYEISTEVLEFALEHAGELDYLAGWEPTIRELLDRGITHPTESITWRLHRGDFSRQPHEAPAPSVIFFDPYSPARNSEMWNLETFRSMWNAVSAPDSPPCTMTNYTRSTSVRVTMLLAGWFVGTGVPTGEKEVTTMAANRLELLKEPLDAVWLARVRSSTNAEPMRGRNNERGPISGDDYARLIAHPQFRGML